MSNTVQLRGAKIPVIGFLADHYWFVIDKKGKKDRFEIWQKKNAGGQSWSHLHKNLKAPESGVGNGESWLTYEWSGSEADKLIQIIEDTPIQYENRNFYLYWPGPNSNTYVQWVLNKAHLEVMLGSRAIGKDYLGLCGIQKFGSIFQISTPLLGIKIRWSSRWEIHILGLAFGVDLKPFQLIMPFFN